MTPDNETYPIDDNVAVPVNRRGAAVETGKRQATLASLQPGESFLLPDRSYATAYDMWRSYQFDHPGTKFTGRKVASGVRIWRVA